jgi:glutathione S-transferase
MESPMPHLVLVSHVLCPFVQRAAISLAEKGVPFARRDIDLAAKPDWFLAISPTGKVPVLLVDGKPIFESAVILEYLDDTIGPALHPADPLARAEHRGYMELGSAILGDIAGFYSAADAPTFEAKRAELARKLARVEDRLVAGPFFDGDAFSLVDAVYAPIFRYFDVIEEIGDFAILDGKARIARWRRAHAAPDSVRSPRVGDNPERLRAFLAGRSSLLADEVLARAA